jgi:hypothetical protein
MELGFAGPCGSGHRVAGCFDQLPEVGQVGVELGGEVDGPAAEPVSAAGERRGRARV